MNYGLSPKKKEQLRCKIELLIGKGLNDSQIAEKLGRVRTDIIYWRKIFKIRSIYAKSKSLRLKTAICLLLNKEDPHDCLTDKQIREQLLNNSIETSLPTVARCRRYLKIPPARKIRNQFITRSYLYFKHDRIVWTAMGKHFYQKSKRKVNYK